MPLLPADWFRGPFVPMAPNEPTHFFAARMRECERRVPFRRWRPVWQVQISTEPSDFVDVPAQVLYLGARSSLMRRDNAVLEAKRKVADYPARSIRVVDVGTGDVAFATNRYALAA